MKKKFSKAYELPESGQCMTDVAENIERESKLRQQHAEKYPMCNRLSLEQATKRKILDFLDFLSHEGISLCKHDERRFGGSYWPVTEQGEKLVHKYLDIDDAALERERRQMLEELQEKT